MTAVVMIEAVVILLLAVLVVGLLRSHAEILRALHDLGVNLDDDSGDQTFRLRPGLGHQTTDRPGSVDLRRSPSGVVEAQRPVDDPALLGEARDLSGETPDGEAAAGGAAAAPSPATITASST